MFLNEWKKIITNKVFLAFVLLVLFINGGYLYWNNGLNEMELAVYHQTWQEVSALEEEVRAETMQERYQKIIESFFSPTIQEDAIYQSEAYEELIISLESVDEYNDNINIILGNVERQLNKQSTTAYEKREANKVAQVYEQLQDVEPQLVPSRGLEKLFDNPIMDCCYIFALLMCIFLVTTTERQKEYSLLSKVTYYGRNRHVLAKAVGVMGTSALLLLLLFGENFLLLRILYPFPSMDVPIQSVYALCPLQITLAEFIVLYLFLKWCFSLFCCSIIFLICYGLRSTIAICAVVSAMIAVCVMSYNGMVVNSYLSGWLAINPIASSQVIPLLEQANYMNILGFPQSKVVYMLIIWLGSFVIGICLSMKIYSYQEERSTITNRGLSLERGVKWGVVPFIHELYKILVVQKIGLVIIGAIVLACVSFIPETGQGGSQVDFFYDIYSESVQGVFDERVFGYIEANRENLNGLMEQYDDFNREYVIGLHEKAFAMMQQYAQYLSEKEGSYYICNDAFDNLTGANEYKNKMYLLRTMLMLAVGIVCFVLAVSIDYKHNEIKLIQSTICGRTVYWRNKMVIGLLIGLTLMIIFWVPVVANELSYYGTEFIHTSASNLMHLSHVWQPITIAMYIVWVQVKRFILLLSAMGVGYMLESKIKNSIASIVFLYVVFELPLLIRLIQ